MSLLMAINSNGFLPILTIINANRLNTTPPYGAGRKKNYLVSRLQMAHYVNYYNSPQRELGPLVRISTFSRFKVYTT